MEKVFGDDGVQLQRIRRIDSHRAMAQIIEASTPEGSSYDQAVPQVWFDHMQSVVKQLDAPDTRPFLQQNWVWYYPPQGVAGHIFGMPMHVIQAIHQLIEEGRLYIRER